MHIGNSGTKARLLSFLIPRRGPEALPFVALLLRSQFRQHWLQFEVAKMLEQEAFYFAVCVRKSVL